MHNAGKIAYIYLRLGTQLGLWVPCHPNVDHSVPINHLDSPCRTFSFAVVK